MEPRIILETYEERDFVQVRPLGLVPVGTLDLLKNYVSLNIWLSVDSLKAIADHGFVWSPGREARRLNKQEVIAYLRNHRYNA